MAEQRVYRIALALEAQNFMQTMRSLEHAWSVFTAAIEQTQGALWNATVLGFQMSVAGRNWVENLYDIATQADVIRLKLASFEQAVRTSGESMDVAVAAVQRLSDQFDILPDQVANAMGLLLRKGYAIEEATVLLERFADAAVNVGQDIADGMEAGASALLQERSILLNSVGIAENISTAFQQYADALNKSVSALTEAEKRQAMYNLVIQSTANRVGLAREYLGGFRGEIQKLTRAWRRFIQDFGKGVAAGLAPFITGIRTTLDVLNALPRPIRTILGMFATWASIATLLGGVIFLTVSNILRFVTTVKRTMADTIRAIALGVRAFREANQIIVELGLASAQAGRALTEMARGLLMAHAAANAPGLAAFANNLTLIATNVNAAERAVGVLMEQLHELRRYKNVALFSAFEPDRRILDNLRDTLSTALLDLRRFELKASKIMSKALGAKVAPEALLVVPFATRRSLAQIGLQANTLADLWETALRAINGEIDLTAQQLKALERAITDTVQATALFAMSADEVAAIVGKREAKAFAELTTKLKKHQTELLTAMAAWTNLRRIQVAPTVDIAEFEKQVLKAFEEAGLKASIVFDESVRRRLAAGQILSGADLIAGIEAIRAWPKELTEAQVKARNFADVVELSSRDIQRAMQSISQITYRTMASYELAMTNMSAITRTTVQTLISLFERLRLYGAAAAIQDFVLLMTPASVTRTLERAGEEMIAQVRRLGTESGTALAYTFFSALQVIEAMLPRFMRRLRIFQFFGKQSPYKFLTRGASDAAEAALLVADSAGLLGRTLQRLNALSQASYTNLSLLGRVGKVAATAILYLSDVLGFLIRGLLVIVRQVPIVGWLVALAVVSEKTRTAIGSLGKSIIGVVIALIKAITDVIGAFTSVVVTIGEATGAFKVFRAIIAGVAFALETLAHWLRQTSVKIREWALYARRAVISVKLRFAVLGRRQLEAELKQIDEQIKKLRGEAEANAKRYQQKIIDLFGPRWSKALEAEFNAVVDSFRGFAKQLEDAAGGARIDESFVEQVEALREKVLGVLDRMGVDAKDALARMRAGLSIAEIFPDVEFAKANQIKGILNLLDQIDSIHQAVTDSTRRGLLSSKQLISVIDGYIAYLQDLIKRMEEAGTRTEDRAQLENFINNLKKTRDALKDTAEELDKFIQKVRDSQLSVEIELDIPETRRPFKELENEIAKLEEQARGQFKGGDLIEAMVAIHEYAAKKRLLIERKFAEEFQALYEDNWARINDIIARGIEDELEKLRYERDNAIRETIRRYDEQIKRYGIGTAEAIRLEEQKQAEIAALQALYAKREQQLIADRLRKERQLFLDHYTDLRRIIDENWQSALDLYRKHLDRLNAVIEAELNAQRDLFRRQRTLGVLTPEEEALRIAEAERKAAEKRIAYEREYQRIRLRVAEESNRAQLDLTIKRLNLQREREIADIERSVADARRRGRLIAETNRYYDRLIAEERRKSALELYNLQEELATREIQLREELASKEREVEQRRLEQRIATYNRIADATVRVARQIAEAGDAQSVARAIEYLSTRIIDLSDAGDEASQAIRSLREELDRLEQQLVDIARQSIDAATQSIEKLGDITLDLGLDDVDKALRDTTQFVDAFGAKLAELPRLLESIADLPEEVRGNAYRAVAPMIDALRSIKGEIDSLREQRVVLADLIETGRLPTDLAKQVREQIAQIDSAISDALSRYEEYVRGTVDKANKAVRSIAAEYAINTERAKIDLERLRAETEALRKRVGNISINVDVELARARLRAAEENLATILRYADQIADARKREELIAKAQNEVVQRQLELELRLDEARRRRLREARDALDVYEAQLTLDMRRLGVYGDLADVVSRLATIDDRIDIAKQLGDEREVVRLERERLDLNRRLVRLQLDQAEAANAIALRMVGVKESVADAIARLATLGRRVEIAIDTGDLDQLRSLLDEQKRLIGSLLDEVGELAKSYATFAAEAGRGFGEVLTLIDRIRRASPQSVKWVDVALATYDEWATKVGEVAKLHDHLATLLGKATRSGAQIGKLTQEVEALGDALVVASGNVASLAGLTDIARSGVFALRAMRDESGAFASELERIAEQARRELGPALTYAIGLTQRLADRALAAAERYADLARSSRDAARSVRDAVRATLDQRGVLDKLREFTRKFGRLPNFYERIGLSHDDYVQAKALVERFQRDFERASRRIRDLLSTMRFGGFVDPNELRSAVDEYVQAGRELEDLFGRRFVDVDLLDRVADALDRQGNALDVQAKRFARIATTAIDYMAQYAAELQRRYGSEALDTIKAITKPMDAIGRFAEAIRSLDRVDTSGAQRLASQLSDVFERLALRVGASTGRIGRDTLDLVSRTVDSLANLGKVASGIRAFSDLGLREVDRFAAGLARALDGVLVVVDQAARKYGSSTLALASDLLSGLGGLRDVASVLRDLSQLGMSQMAQLKASISGALEAIAGSVLAFATRVRDGGLTLRMVVDAINAFARFLSSLRELFATSKQDSASFAQSMGDLAEPIRAIAPLAERASMALRNLFGANLDGERMVAALDNVVMAFDRFASAIESGVARIIGVLDKLSDVQIRAPRVEANVEAPKITTTQIELTNVQSLADAVGAKVMAAISSMKLEPIVNFNGQICESPELDAIAQAVMPQVMDAIRNELKRRQALGQVQAAGAAC